MRLQVVAGHFKSRIQKKLLEQAWPHSEVVWGVQLEDVTICSHQAKGAVLVCVNDVDQGVLRRWLEGEVRHATDCMVFLVLPEGHEVPDWLPMMKCVHVLYEPLDIHVMKNILNEKAPSSAVE